MAKRGYKLQEFVAHSGNVNCLRIGRKTFRHFLTGGDDQKVNLWSIGKPTCLMSLCGHTSPVESVAFDSAEVLVLAGSSSGAIKLWDLEETKMVRTVTGHRSYCTALEFHPFGEFFASGSMDTNLKIWDIRKKGCIHTYKGHTRGISTIKFSPDGRWVVSGGLDNVVKVWDLTAGKLLHDFKFHEGHVRSMEFHPLEFLLATGSADRTVKFWDLETFEMIGTTRREGTGVRSITFHPDGRTLFCGLDDSLKVYSWEPVICHDSVDMGWSTLGDLCIHDEKLLGGAYHENTVGVWVADVSLIKPCGGGMVDEQHSPSEQKVELQESPLERTGSHKRSNSSLRSSSPDNDSKDIKNIYIDSGNCVTSRKEGSLSSPMDVVPSESKEMSNQGSQKKGSSLGLSAKSSGPGRSRSFVVPNIIPRDIPDGKESVGSGRESVSPGRANTGMPLRPSHIRKPSNSKLNVEKISVALESKDFENMKMVADTKKDIDFNSRLNADNNAKESSEDKHSDINSRLNADTNAKESSEDKHSDINSRLNAATNAKESSEDKHSDTKSVPEKFEKTSPVALPSDQENSKKALDGRKGVNAIKVVNGVAVVRGRTRSLVERFEKRESLSSGEVCMPDLHTLAVSGAPKISPLHTPDTATPAVSQAPKTSTLQLHTPDTATDAVSQAPKTPPLQLHTPDTATDAASQAPKTPPLQLHTPDMATPAISQASKTSTLQLHTPDTATDAVSQAPKTPPLQLHTPDMATPAVSQAPKTSTLQLHTPDTVTHPVSQAPKTSPLKFCTPDTATHGVRRAPKTSPLQLHTPDMATHTITQVPKTSPLHTPKMATPAVTRTTKTSIFQDGNQKIVDPQESGTNDSSIIGNLMQSHDVLLSTFRSRLTKLQVIRHFWERKDVKGAINATRKLPDHSVQADIVSVLVERMEIITLDLFSCLLPVLLGLLDSKLERHAVISLEMLLKLVAVFGPVVRSTVSAPPTVGVDLHAEQRLECCKQCFAHLQNIQKIIPALIRRGGVLAKSALELNLVLQES